MVEKALVLHLDFHKTIQLPKLTSQDAYFKRRLTTRLFGVFHANRKKLHAYVYPATVGGEGPDEVMSCLDLFLQTQAAGLKHLVLWADNCPAQFKENYLFFYLQYLVKTKRFSRVDLKFLLEGHTYAICDRRFASIEAATKRFETIETPTDWVAKLKEQNISNLVIQEVSLDILKSFKTFLRNAYVSRQKDVHGQKFAVRRLAWLNFGIGEATDSIGGLVAKKLEDGACFARVSIDPYEEPLKINFLKKKQSRSLNPKGLKVRSVRLNPVPSIIKENCLELASKYLSVEAQRYYNTLPVEEADADDNNDDDDDDDDEGEGEEEVDGDDQSDDC